MLTELLMFQKATLAIEGDEEELEGTLTINVGGHDYTFRGVGQTIGAVVSNLEFQYLSYNWSEGEPAIVEVRGGVAEITEGFGVVVDWDELITGQCPMCKENVRESISRECGVCGFKWEESDE